MPIWSRMTIQVDPQTPVKMMNGTMIEASILVVEGSWPGSQRGDRGGQLADRLQILVPAGDEPNLAWAPVVEVDSPGARSAAASSAVIRTNSSLASTG